MLHFIADQRGAESASATELAILLDYYFMHVLALLTMRIWDDGDPDENFERLERARSPNCRARTAAASSSPPMPRR